MGAGDLEVVGMVIPVLAHMGGIDEIGIFVVPALLAIYVLRRADRQARKRAEAEAAKQPADTLGSPEADGPL